jgi:hypothetical protein
MKVFSRLEKVTLAITLLLNPVEVQQRQTVTKSKWAPVDGTALFPLSSSAKINGQIKLWLWGSCFAWPQF